MRFKKSTWIIIILDIVMMSIICILSPSKEASAGEARRYLGSTSYCPYKTVLLHDVYYIDDHKIDFYTYHNDGKNGFYVYDHTTKSTLDLPGYEVKMCQQEKNDEGIDTRIAIAETIDSNQYDELIVGDTLSINPF
jgi:hypothetical protein